MTFITTSLAIAGASAMAIPIIIHLLFRRRRRPIEWAAMRFLIEAFRRQKKRLRLEQFLLLATRCLIVGLLGAALARPLLERAGLLPLAGGQRDVFLVIDNGLVSAARDSDGRSALARHVEQAVAIVRGLGPGDRAALITAAQPARPLVVPPSTDHAAIIEMLESLEPAESATDLPAALAAAAAAIDQLETDRCSAVVYLWSDFRRGSVSLEAPLAAGLIDRGPCVTLLAAAPASQPAPNVQVTSMQPLRSLIIAGPQDGGTQVSLRLSRNGGGLDRAVSTVRLTGEGLAAAAPRVVEWQPGQMSADVDFMVDFEAAGRADRQVGLTASIDDDLLPIDNARHLVVALRSAARVVLADRRPFGSDQSLEQLSAGRWLSRALAPSESSPMQVIEVDPSALEAADLRDADAALLPRPDLIGERAWEALREFVGAGGLLLIMPPSDINVHQWTDQAPAALGLPWRLALESEAAADGFALAAEQPMSELLRLIHLDLAELLRPVIVQRRLAVDMRETRAEGVLLFADGSPLLIASSLHAGSEPDAADGAGAAPRADSAGMVIYLATATDLNWTNLPSQPLMVPLMHELIRQGASLVRGAREVHVGDRPRLRAGPAAAWIERDGADGRISMNPDGRPATALERSGLLTVTDSAGLPLETVAVNIRADGSNTDAHAPAAVSAWLRRSGPWQAFEPGSPGASLAAAPTGMPLSGILLLVVLALAVIETMLARWFSHARQSMGGPSWLGSIFEVSSQTHSTAKGL